MERLTIPDVKIDEHTTRRTFIDENAVREGAMDLYDRLKLYENLFDNWNLGELDFDSLEKWHERMVWNTGECDRQFDEIEKLKQENEQLHKQLSQNDDESVIKVNTIRTKTKLVIDGIDVSNIVTSYNISQTAGDSPKMIIGYYEDVNKYKGGF